MFAISSIGVSAAPQVEPVAFAGMPDCH